MNRKILLPVLVILIFSVLISRAQKSRHPVLKDGSSYIKLLSTNQWSTIKNGQNDSGYTYTIIWKGSKPPETFFWRPKAGGWMTCAVTRVHARKDHKDVFDEQYDKEEIDFAQIHKGDTLDVMPMRGGRDIMPKLIPASMTNRLFFMVKGNSNWWYAGGAVKKK